MDDKEHEFQEDIKIIEDLESFLHCVDGDYFGISVVYDPLCISIDLADMPGLQKNIYNDITRYTEIKKTFLERLIQEQKEET